MASWASSAGRLSARPFGETAAAARISSESELTTIVPALSAARADSTDQTTSGFPPKGLRFLRGTPFEPARAGMTVRTFMTGILSNKIK